MESKAFHICPFCRAPSLVSEQRCKGCTRSLVGLPLAVYGSEIDAALAHSSPKPLMDLPLRAKEPTGGEGGRPVVPALPLRPAVAARKPGPPAMRRPAREPRSGAIVGMAAALAATIAAGATLVRPRRPAPVAPTSASRAALPRPSSPRVTGSGKAAGAEAPARIAVRATAPLPVPVAPTAGRPRSEIYTLHPDVRPDHGDVRADPADVRRARQPVVGDTRTEDDDVNPPDEDALVLRAQLRRAEESRDRLAERVDRLRARMNVPVVTDVDRYQRLQDELETAREDLDRAQADVARWRRAPRRVG